jgi:hypothetical protein
MSISMVSHWSNRSVLSLRCRFWLDPVRSWRLMALFIAIIGGASMLFAQPGNDEPAVPIQRIFLEPERAAKELEKVPQGTLLALPRQEFEDRLERVCRAVKARAKKPRLTRAHYSAELIDRAFANGSGQWTLASPGDVQALLPIDPLNLALSKVKWDDGSDAIVAEFDGKSLGLLVKPAGKPTCLFDWSARGTLVNDGIAFNLAVPFCPLTTFEFKLPADYWLSAPSGVAVVTGPHDTESQLKRLWKMQVTGSRPVDLTVRKVTQPKGPAPTIFARVENTQQLAHDRIAVEHDFQIDIPNGSVRELVLEGSGSLQPYQVTLVGGEVTNWQWTEVAAKKGPKGILMPASGVLTIQFPQPVQGKLKNLHVKSVCASTDIGTWVSPALRVRGAVSRGEKLQVRFLPDAVVGRWDPGTFQPTNLATESDGAQVLSLAETASDTASSRRPTMILPAKNVELFTTESCQWHVDPRGASLNAEIQFALTRGQLFELRFKLPAPVLGYQIETPDMQPPELLRGWRLDGNVLVVELKQPFTSLKKAILKLHLRASIRGLTTGPRNLAYPELEPLDSTTRHGTVSVHIDPIFQPQLVNSSVSLASWEEESAGKSGARPSYHFALRDQRLNAQIRVTPQPVQTQMRGKHLLTLSEKHAVLRYRWEAQPILGAPEFLDFRCPPGFPSWKVKEEEGSLKIHHWERLHWPEALPYLLPIGAPAGLNALATESLLPTGTLWRFHLTEPLRSKASFTVEAVSPPGQLENDWRQVSLLMPSVHAWHCIGGAFANEILPKSARTKVWSVPLMTPVQRTNVEQEIAIDSADEPLGKLVSDGAFDLPAALKADKAITNFTLSQSDDSRSGHAASITLWTNPAKRTVSQLELCDEARISSYIYRDGRIYQRIQFRLWHWRNRSCDLKLPGDLQVLAVKVHDQWLDHLEVASSPSEVHLSMPFDQNGEYVRYEILTRSAQGRPFLAAGGLQEIRHLRVHWPVEPLEVRTRLFLEDGLTPLDATSLSRIGVPRRIAEKTESPRWLRQAWNWGQAWLPIGAASSTAIWLDTQKNGVLLAEARFRRAASEPMKLAQALDRFALDYVKDTTALVIDRMALRSLGLSADTVVAHEALSPQASGPFWEKLKLVYVSCPSGALLTSAQRLQSMGINPDDPTEVAELDDAVKEAILHGRDASASFYLVPAWVDLPPDERFAFTTGSTPIGMKRADESPEMTEWEFRPAEPRLGRTVIVDAVRARIMGVLMAFLAALVLWKVSHALQPVASFRVHILVMVGILSIVIWSSPVFREFFLWPTCFVVSLGALCAVVRLLRQRGNGAASGPSTVTTAARTAAVLALAVFGATWSVTAQTPAPRSYPVYVIGGAKPSVLVTPDLMAKLDELEKQSALGPVGVVLVNAKYTGKVKDTQAKIEVLYEIYSLKDKANLVIPLTGVQLAEGAFLDGAPVFLAPHKSGYTVPVRGVGPHHLRLSFSVAVRTSPKTDQLDLRFMTPKLSQNEITLHWQDPVQAVHCLRGWGEDTSFTDPRQAINKWQAQLGYENEVHLRWSSTSAPTASKAIEVKEAHFWDLRRGSLSLWTTLNYAIGKGSLTQLDVSMPVGLQVRSLEALATPFSAQSGPIVVKQWTVAGKGSKRRLNVEFVQPVTGHVTLNLEMVPQPFGQKAKLLLTLPAPQQGKSTGLLAYRLDAAEVRSVAQNLVAVQSIPVADFEQQWKKLNGPLLPPATRAKSFQRTNPQPAALELWIEPSVRQAAFHLKWDVDRHVADFKGRATITSPKQDLFMVEFFVDNSITLADVTGADVRRWHRHDSLLQIWLKQPCKETTLEIKGFRKPTATQKSFVVPCIYPLDMQLAAATLAIHPAPGLQLKAEQLRGVHADPVNRNRFAMDNIPRPLPWPWRGVLFPYYASFQLSPATVLPEATIVTKVHASESKIEGAVGIRLLTQRGQLPGLTVHLKDWDDHPWQFDAPGAIVQRSTGKGPKHAIWTLKYPAGMPQEVFVTLRGRVARDLPAVDIEGAAIRGQWLAWRDVEIQSSDQGKPITNPRGIKEKLIPFEADAWFKQDANWNGADAPKSLRAVLPKTLVLGSGRVLASTEKSWLSEDGEWQHEATFWVQATERTDLRFKFTAPIEMLSAWVDGHLHSVVHPVPLEYVLTVDANRSPRFITLRWKYTDAAERTVAPIIAGIQIEQIALPTHERLAWIPTNMRVAEYDSRTAPTYPDRILQDAQRHMEIAAALAQESARSMEFETRILAEQQRFYACIRHAEYSLSILRSADPDFDPAPFLKRLSDLMDRNVILAKGRYDDQRKIAERSRKISLRTTSNCDPESGAIPFLISPDLPSLKLQSIVAQQIVQQRLQLELVLLAAIFLFVFSYFRRGSSVLSFAAPEIAIVLLIIAMAQFGVGLIGIALVAALAIVRFRRIVDALKKRAAQ